MAGRKPRGLSPDDAALWRKVTAGATPLHPTPEDPPDFVPEPPAHSARPKPAKTDTPAIRAPTRDRPRVSVDLAPDPHAALRQADARMDRRRLEKLRRGRLAPEARIDLHGMTAARAHGALSDFILSAHSSGLRLVLVITGKGRVPDLGSLSHRPGILRHSVPHWLAAPTLAARILQIVPAHLRHGGGGAYYVYLRRHRDGRP